MIKTSYFSLKQDGFYASLFKANDSDKIMIVVGGSEGSRDVTNAIAKRFAEDGINTLALIYWNYPELPDSFNEVPIEPVELAAKKLRELGYKKIGIYGFSMGAQLALISASYFSNLLNFVIAVSPFSNISQGFVWSRKPLKVGTFNTSAWSYKGKALPYSKFNKNYLGIALNILSNMDFSLLPLYSNAINDTNKDHIIDIVNIKAPILFQSVTNDQMWPSREASNIMINRLKAQGFKYPIEHYNYDNASHFLIPVEFSLAKIFRIEREKPDLCKADREEAYRDALSFIHNNM